MRSDNINVPFLPETISYVLQIIDQHVYFIIYIFLTDE